MQITFKDDCYKPYSLGDILACLGWWVSGEGHWEEVLSWNLVLACLLSAAATCALEETL